MTAIVTPSGGVLALAARAVARDFAEQAMSQSTLRVYAVAWRHFSAWCAATGVQALPADPVDVAAYVASLATTHAPNTIDQRLAAIAQAHRLHNYEWNGRHSAISATRRGVLRQHGRPPKQAAAIGTDAIAALVGTCDDTPAGVRDRALLLLGFAGALRRSEIVSLLVGDVAISAAGMQITIRRSKTDAAGAGAYIGVPRGQAAETCPVGAMQAWLALLGRAEGPLFRRLSKAGRLIGSLPMSGCAVWDILERRAGLAGLAGELRPHGLRAGFVTVAYQAGARDDDIMQHTRHRDVRTMRGYIRRAKLLIDSPAGLLGL